MVYQRSVSHRRCRSLRNSRNSSLFGVRPNLPLISRPSNWTFFQKKYNQHLRDASFIVDAVARLSRVMAHELKTAYRRGVSRLQLTTEELNNVVGRKYRFDGSKAMRILNIIGPKDSRIYRNSRLNRALTGEVFADTQNSRRPRAIFPGIVSATRFKAFGETEEILPVEWLRRCGRCNSCSYAPEC